VIGALKSLIVIAVFLFSCSSVKPGLAGREQTDVKENAVQDKNRRGTSGVINVKDSSVPVYQDIYDMIRGRVAGVEVSGRSIKIRGTNSLNVSTEPLFVVDGVIVREIDDIAPETVRSIEVLKGPDASVYGARGSNGVIVITRKKGMDQE
jgi:TonB-dependent SusC/RagA subfamily outer membrane receptor